MKLLIVGCNGQTGWELCRQAPDFGFEAVGLDFPEIDITDSEGLEKKVPPDIDLIVNAAAYTAVDKAESDAEAAFRVNAEGPANLGSVCLDRGIPFIHISTDYVFDGKKKTPYVETDPVAPLGIYGKSKEAGESSVRHNISSHVIIRTAWLSGIHGQNFVKKMLRLGKEHERLRIVADQKGCPTFAFDLAEAILKMAERILSDPPHALWGTYHYSGAGEVSWYDFAKEIFRKAEAFTDIKVHDLIPITTQEYPTPAQRPINSVLDCTKIICRFNIHPKPWAKRLDLMLKRLLADAPSLQ